MDLPLVDETRRMGSCFSSRRGGAAPPAAVRHRFACSRDPPPDPDAPHSQEEETVKEVLSSETPVRREPGAEKIEEAGRIPIDDRSVASSEIYNLSENTTTEKRVGAEGDTGAGMEEPSPATAKYRRKRSVSGELPIKIKMDRSVDVGCVSSPSHVRKKERAVGRTYSAREREREREVRSRGPPVGNVSRRDPGERSIRRSVSPGPAKQRNDGGQCRSLSAPRMIGNGKGSTRLTPTPTPAPAEPGGRKKVLNARTTGGVTEGKETLENPLVSLECFIFL